MPALTTHISIFLEFILPLLCTSKSAGTGRDVLGFGILFGHTWHRCYITILSNGTVPGAGCGDDRLVNATADAGGLSGSDGDDGRTAHWY